ncbi:uncharacterized protein EI90DRAFT_3138873 [Cantharellus anzutake]|uniref:uncharacterized protein n=1 Tax=Cantharellus anzutake TaxID=1750568 RepID=UPI0019043CFF|nr:uncharacterized protein EI90DRAFT_3138873 [Cantharellus anzutake]KAF8311019.1 hypothetical protein EI90DRAFT_3138873 [Cantharellus anzutake]
MHWPTNLPVPTNPATVTASQQLDGSLKESPLYLLPVHSLEHQVAASQLLGGSLKEPPLYPLPVRSSECQVTVSMTPHPLPVRSSEHQVTVGTPSLRSPPALPSTAMQPLLSVSRTAQVRKPKATKKTTKVKSAVAKDSASETEDFEDTPHEDCPFEAAASLDDIDVGLAANTEFPMELDGEPLTAAELAAVDLAVNEFSRKVWTLTAEADTTFVEEFGIKCTDAEHKSASRIMDIPSKLASKVNHSIQLLEGLEHIILGLKGQIESSARRLITKVPTRWGSEYNCLAWHQMLKDAIDDFTSVPQHGCEAYHLSPMDWDQLNGLKNILNLFDALIKKFDASTTFEVAEIYEAFEELEVSLDKARNDVNLDKVVRIGANRALFILGKYYNKLDECEVISKSPLCSGASRVAGACGRQNSRLGTPGANSVLLGGGSGAAGSGEEYVMCQEQWEENFGL